MKKNIGKLLAFGIALLLFVACEDDPTLTVLEKVEFSSAPEVSVETVTLTEENMNETVVEFSWPAVVYPVTAPVTYTLQFDIPLDTTGSSGWANAIERGAGEDALSAALTGGELNAIASDLGIEHGTESTIVMRVRASMDRDVHSAAVGLRVSTFKEEVVVDYPALYIAGDYQGWNISAPSTIVSVNDDGIYEGYIYIPAGGTNEFKLYAQPDWEPTSYGYESEGKIMIANFAGANFTVPSDGYYLFSVNLNEMTYLLVKTSWGIIGAATPGGWDVDTPLTYDPGSQTWSATADMIADGSFKFRANNAWQFDFGNADGKLGYANHPWREYIEQPHFTVPADGNYTISLDLHIPGNYTYSIVKN